MFKSQLFILAFMIMLFACGSNAQQTEESPAIKDDSSQIEKGATMTTEDGQVSELSRKVILLIHDTRVEWRDLAYSMDDPEPMVVGNYYFNKSEIIDNEEVFYIDGGMEIRINKENPNNLTFCYEGCTEYISDPETAGVLWQDQRNK